MERAERLIPPAEGFQQVVLTRREYTRPVTLQVPRDDWLQEGEDLSSFQQAFAYPGRALRRAEAAITAWSDALGGSLHGQYRGSGLDSFWFHRILEEHLELLEAVCVRGRELPNLEAYERLRAVDPAYARVAAAHLQRHGFFRTAWQDDEAAERYRLRDEERGPHVVSHRLSQVVSMEFEWERCTPGEQEFAQALVADWSGGLDELLTAARNTLHA